MASSSVPAELLSIHGSFTRRAQEVVTYQVPRLEDCTSATLLADYEAEINASVEGLRRQVNELKLATDEAESESERRTISQIASDDSKQLESIRQAVRKALLSARRSVENARTLDARAGLLLAADSAKERTGGRGGGSSGEDKLMTSSQDVTDALRRTVALMSSELEKSAMSSQLLEESTQTLSSLSMQYGSLSTLMTNSAHMIRTMEREDLIGKAMMAASFLFFLGCIFYILYVRILSRGIGLISFVFRLFGLNKLLGGTASRSMQDIEEKLELAKHAAKTVSTAPVAASLTSLVTAAAATAATAASSFAGKVTPAVQESPVDIQDDLDSLTQTMVPADLLQDIDTATLTRTRRLPTERIEL